MICYNRPHVLGCSKFGIFSYTRKEFLFKQKKQKEGTGTKTQIWFLRFVLVIVKMVSLAHKQNFAYISYIKNRNLFAYVIEEARVQTAQILI